MSGGMLARAREIVRRLRYRMKRRDDFDWSTYMTDHYGPQLANELDPFYSTQLAKVEWSVREDRIVLAASRKPLHPYHRLLYETALLLGPGSIFELGFGGGDHLANLRLLIPDASIGGVDVSERQREFALERNSAQLADVHLIVRDMTRPQAAEGLLGTADLVFSNAVLMHIHGAERYRAVLRNMLAISRRFVLLRERWDTHDFVADLRELLPVTPYIVAGHRAAALLIDKQARLVLPKLTSDQQLRALDSGNPPTLRTR